MSQHEKPRPERPGGCHNFRTVDGYGLPKGGDGAALVSVAHPIEVTPEMIGAGDKAFEKMWAPGNTSRQMVEAVYRAMTAAAPVWPDDISEDATVEVEHPLYAMLRAIKVDCERTDPDDLMEQRKLVTRIYGVVCKVVK